MLIQIAGGDPLDGRGFVGHPWPSKGWPTNPRPQDFSPMNEGVSMANEGVTIETLAIEWASTPNSVKVKKLPYLAAKDDVLKSLKYTFVRRGQINKIILLTN